MNTGASLPHVRHQQSTFARHWLNSVCACTITNLCLHTKLSMHFKSAETQGTGLFDFSVIKSQMSMCARQMLSSQHCFMCVLYHAVMKCFLIGSQSVIIKEESTWKEEKTLRACVQTVNKRQWWRCRETENSYHIKDWREVQYFLIYAFCTCDTYLNVWDGKKKIILAVTLVNFVRIFMPLLQLHSHPRSPFSAITVVSTAHML